MNRAVVSAVAGLIAAIQTAHANVYENGNGWLNACLSKDKLQQLQCSNYTLGVAHGLMVWQELDGTAQVCIDPRLDVLQLIDVGVRFMRLHPQDRHRGTPYLLLLAFQEAWPCNADFNKGNTR